MEIGARRPAGESRLQTVSILLSPIGTAVQYEGGEMCPVLQAGKCNSGFCIIRVYFEAGYDDENQRNIIKRFTDLSYYQLFLPARSDGLESVSLQELSFY